MVMNIQKLRTGNGLTQRELGARMGVDATTVNKWESEIALPRARDLPQLARVLGCSIGELFAEPEDTDEAG